MDTITKANELNYFFWSMICGVAMTIVYDFLRARRREKKQVGLFYIYRRYSLVLRFRGARILACIQTECRYDKMVQFFWNRTGGAYL